MAAHDFYLQLDSGRVRTRRIGSPNAPLVLFLHGLSAHLHAFDHIAERLAAPDRQLVTLDLRGRGRSEVTPPGTYGLEAHCRDVLQAASLLEAPLFDLVGWSMGAQIAIGVANRAPDRIRRIVLIDHTGIAPPDAAAQARKGLARLDVVVKSPAAYVAAFQAASGISPWSAFWDHYFQYELGPQGKGFKATTSKLACLEDLVEFQRYDWSELWSGLTMPVLLVRCLLPLNGSCFVTDDLRDRLRHTISQLRIVEVASDHNTVMSNEHTSTAIDEFLAQPILCD